MKVAVLDSELSLNHPEMVDKKIHYEEFIPSMNYNYHGTAISSLICGNNLGVAPEVELIHIKMLSDVHGSGRSWDKAFSYAIRNKADIICMSIGTKATLSPSMEQSLENARSKGILITAPSGNEGLTLLRNPADNENVMAVGGLDNNGAISKKSNRDKRIEGYAPSEDIIVADSSVSLGYKKETGTSFANAIYSGQLALILSYMREIDKEMDVREFVSDYNKRNREQGKKLNMKKVKIELDNL